MDINGVACPVCNKIFSKKNSCTRHMKNVHKLNNKGERITEETVSCVLCDKIFRLKSSLQNHMNAVHLAHDDSSKIFSCTNCKYTTGYKGNLLRHVSNVHNDSKNSEQPTLYKCKTCTAVYKLSKSLKRHEYKYHGVGKSAGNVKKKCALCSFTSESKSNKPLHEHLKTNHDIFLKWETHHFSSFDDFKTWKEEMETRTTSSYVKKHGLKTYQVFNCHRCGTYKSKGKGQRHLKIMGSCKINRVCPAAIYVKLKENNITVKHQSIHVGHGKELKHLRLTAKERRRIATKLAGKVPPEEVLKDIRSSMTDSELQRLHLTQRKDILNIEKSFNLNSEAMLHPYDPVSVEAWVQTLKSSKDTALLVYKPQGEESELMPQLLKDDFVLIYMTEAQKTLLQKYGTDTICVYGTHGLNNYKFQLYTILVLDESREGFPVAFMFSNRGDERIYNIFYEEIKKTAGIIEAQVFMSDMEEAFYSAWVKSMGCSKIRLFCAWHVLRAWKKNIMSKIKNKEKRDNAFKILKLVLYELDEATFQRLLEAALRQLNSDEETHVFAEYFEKYYVTNDKFKNWAYSYRVNVGINTNMSVENFNKVLKYIYLRGNKVVRLDKTLCAILNLLRDKLYDLLIKIKKGKVVKKLQCLRERHKSSLLMNNSNVIQEEENKWQVLSSGSTEFYNVRKVKSCKTCQLQCHHCQSCFHEFICSCVDNAIKNNMCKHIHLVAKSLIGICKIDEINSTNEESRQLMEVIGTELSKEECRMEESCKEERQLKLLEDWKDISKHMKSLIRSDCNTSEQFTFMRNMIKQSKITLEAMAVTKDRDFEVKSSADNPKKRKIEPQVRGFYSKKKGKKTKRDQQSNQDQMLGLAIHLLNPE